MADSYPPLTWETSADPHPEPSDSLPSEVVSCLQNARYLHLSTCSTDLKPHGSLMNYTYLDSHPFTSSSTPTPSSLPQGPFIIMTTNPSSRKTQNLLANPNVSLVVHDWVSVRAQPRASSPPSNSNQLTSSRSNEGRSSLAAMLVGLNSAEMGKISATINGTASLLAKGSDVERWSREQHLRFNGFSDATTHAAHAASTMMNGTTDADQSLAQLSGSPNSRFTDRGDTAQRQDNDGDDEVRVVAVRIEDGRIADWKGGVRDFVLTRP